MEQPESWKRFGDAGLNISVGWTYTRGRVVLCELDSEDGLYGEFQKRMGDLEHGYYITTDPW